MSLYSQIADSYVAKLLVSIEPAFHRSVELAIHGGDEDLLQLLHELPKSPVRCLTIYFPPVTYHFHQIRD